jgi:hypothetical protein
MSGWIDYTILRCARQLGHARLKQLLRIWFAHIPIITYIDSFLVASEHPCTLYPCDENSESCVASGLTFGDKRDRTCGPCRKGFELRDGNCANLLVEAVANEPVAAGNVQDATNMMSVGLEQGEATKDTLINAASFLSKVANHVCHHDKQLRLF